MRLRRFAGPITAMVLPVFLFGILKRNSSWDLSLVAPTGHFYIVSFISLLAIAIAFTVGIAGRRVRNIKVSFLALSFISLAEMFMVHGLSTPNFLLHANHLPGLTAPASVIMASFWLWLSSLPSDHRLIDYLSRHEKLLLPGWTLILALIGTMGMMSPHLFDHIRLNMYPLNWTVVAVTAALNLITIHRYYRSYLYSQFPLQIAIVYSAGWMIVAQFVIVTGEVWRMSWWLYHFLLLASVIVMLIGLSRQYASNQSLTGAFRALFTTDPVERITSSISPSVKSLMAATESKDTYTAGHNFRVTVYALKIAEQLQLRPDQLRALAHGTIIHDVGKIEIPDTILNKPGKLTPEERAIIERHPVIGYELCRDLGFMKEELEIIRSHHEKWNGEGYPDRLKGEEIPRMARIVAVADVYDALTSERAYRKALSHDEAMLILNQNKGTHFEPDVVEGWERACERDSSIIQSASEITNEKTRVLTLSLTQRVSQG